MTISLPKGIPLLLSLSLLLSACNLPSQTTPTSPPSPDVIATSVALTASAQLTQAAPPPTVPVIASPTTAGPLPTNTTVPTSPPAASPTPIPCNLAGFVTDVTYTDGTEVAAGSTFTKTWRLLNEGSCAWTSGYRLIFDHGDRMNAPSEVPITSGSVEPGETVDISVDLKAPDSPGTYRGYFMLRSPDNIVFGVGSKGQTAFWVEIVVPEPETPTDTPVPSGPDLIVTSMTFSDDPVKMGDPFTVTVKIKNQGDADAGHFSVQWWSSWAVVACNWSVYSLAAGAEKTLTCDYTYGGWSTYDVKAVVDSGNLVAETNEGNNELSATLKVKP